MKPCKEDCALEAFQSKKIKNGQATFIAPLQPSTLAVFPPWGSSKGADRKRLAHCKCSKRLGSAKTKTRIISLFPQ
jgi:hypothetical protein